MLIPHSPIIKPSSARSQGGKDGGAAGAKTEVIVLDASKNEIQQITDTLSGRTNVSAIHIFSHGSEGNLELGATSIDATALDAYADQFSQWRQSLDPGADILLYGCDIGAGQDGSTFISRLAWLTGATVAASSDDTGAPQLGGNWRLEKSTGPIEASLPAPQLALDNYSHLLAAVQWTGAGDGVSWSDPNNWSGGVLPGVNDAVTIAAAVGDPAININSTAGLVQLQSLNSSRPLTLSTGATLKASTIDISRNLTLAGGTIQGGTITTSGGAMVVVSATNIAGTFTNGVTLNGDATVSGQNAALRVSGGMTLNAVIHVTGSTGCRCGPSPTRPSTGRGRFRSRGRPVRFVS